MSLGLSSVGSSAYPNFSVDKLSDAFDELSIALLKNLEQFIQRQLPTDSLVIPLASIEEIQTQLRQQEKKRLLPLLASIAKQYACCEVSSHGVGAAAIGASGSIYLAHTIEFANCSPHSFVNPIQCLIANMRSSGETAIRELAVTEMPTGAELDFLKELSWDNECKIHTCPDQFFFLTGLTKDDPSRQKLILSDGLVKNHLKADTEDYLKGLAQSAGHHSHSPLTRLQAGVAIQTSDGTLYTGSYLETRTYQTLGPLQAALVALLSDKKSYEEISAVVLAEKYNAKFSLKAQTVELLASIAPKLTLATVPF